MLDMSSCKGYRGSDIRRAVVGLIVPERIFIALVRLFRVCRKLRGIRLSVTEGDDSYFIFGISAIENRLDKFVLFLLRFSSAVRYIDEKKDLVI